MLKCIYSFYILKTRDGKVFCNTYNRVLKLSKRPFGFITKIHDDTRRTYRAVENLRFFAA